MCVLVTERLRTSLRGEITKWMLEVKSGVFVGSLSARVRNLLWKKIEHKLGEGRAIMIEPKQNEQHFQILSLGEPSYIPTEFDGLQLIYVPHVEMRKKDNTKNGEKKSREVTTRKRSKDLPKLEWSYPDRFPQNFITRSIECDLPLANTEMKFTGNSSYHEIPPSTLWDRNWNSEVLRCISYIRICASDDKIKEIGEIFQQKKIACIDIETTDYIPRAREGYVNIIGLATLDLREKTPDYRNLKVFQAFNMLRKKESASELLKLCAPYLHDCDVLIVFNKEFDIPILNVVAENYNVIFPVPTKIIDIQEDFYSVKQMEEFLHTKGYILREKSEKGKYSEYYSKFKGDSKGKGKQIEPIGVYNLMDVLTVLLYALRFKK